MLFSLNSKRGEIATILTIGTVIFMGLSILIPTFFGKDKKVIKSGAQEAEACNSDWWCNGKCENNPDSKKVFIDTFGAGIDSEYEKERAGKTQWYLQHGDNSKITNKFGTTKTLNQITQNYCNVSINCKTWFCYGTCASGEVVNRFTDEVGGDPEKAKNLWFGEHERYNDLVPGSCQAENKGRPGLIIGTEELGTQPEDSTPDTMDLNACFNKISAPCRNIEGCGGLCKTALNNGCGYGGCQKWERCSAILGSCLWKKGEDDWEGAKSCETRVGISPLELEAVCRIIKTKKDPTATPIPPTTIPSSTPTPQPSRTRALTSSPDYCPSKEVIEGFVMASTARGEYCKDKSPNKCNVNGGCDPACCRENTDCDSNICGPDGSNGFCLSTRECLKEPTPSPTVTSTPTPTVTSTPTPTIKPTLTPTPTPIPLAQKPTTSLDAFRIVVGKISPLVGVPPKLYEAFLQIENPTLLNLSPQEILEYARPFAVIPGCGPNMCSAAGPLQMTTGRDDRGSGQCLNCCFGEYVKSPQYPATNGCRGTAKPRDLTENNYTCCQTKCPNVWDKYGGDSLYCNLHDNLLAAGKKIRADGYPADPSDWQEEEVGRAGQAYYGNCTKVFVRLGNRTYCDYLWWYYNTL